MTTIETNLFIGGAMDGHRPVLARAYANCNWIRFPKPTDRDRITCEGQEAPVFETVEYRREQLRAQDKVWTVWVLAELSLEDAMARLLECYQPEPVVQP